jgi:hypothetical protein
MRGLKPTFASSSIGSTLLAQADTLCVPAPMPHGTSTSGRLPARAPPLAFL